MLFGLHCLIIYAVLRDKKVDNVPESWHEAEKQLAIIIEERPFSCISRQKNVLALRVKSCKMDDLKGAVKVAFK